MGAFQRLLDEDQRYLILLSLVHMGFDGNDSMIKDALYAYGHRISSNDLRRHLTWLCSGKLVELSTIGPFIKVKLTQQGQDVAEGREQIDGVRRPKAGEL